MKVYGKKVTALLLALCMVLGAGSLRKRRG